MTWIERITRRAYVFAFWMFAVMLVVYIRTLMPGTVGGDAGELQYLLSENPILYPGTHQVTRHWRIEVIGPPTEIVETEGGYFDTGLRINRGNGVVFDFDGTEAVIRWQGEPDAITVSAAHSGMTEYGFDLYSIDPILHTVSTQHIGNGWHVSRLQLSFWQGRTIVRVGIEANSTAVIDSVTILDRIWEIYYPIIAPAGALGILFLLIILDAFRQRFRKSTS